MEIWSLSKRFRVQIQFFNLAFDYLVSFKCLKCLSSASLQTEGPGSSLVGKEEVGCVVNLISYEYLKVGIKTHHCMAQVCYFA